ncbi:MAG TPA: class I SAM-dependent methyltransferase [Pyrinomonadaceae bacterium]|jgi:caffeoyl-CoA O-methyltransferase|nr:class I SAM-dependent methyltransferase [Pyrinomonadaceae bacterium]
MSRHFAFDERSFQYLVDTSVRETDVARRLREETQRLPQAQMQIGPDQGQFLQLLAQLIHAKKTLEVGVFTGYSSLWVALGLPDDGRIVACDVSEEYTAVARRYWKEAGVDPKIDLRLRPALETLDDLLANNEAGTFDFAFIDADKANYENYYERALKLLRVGGLIAVDNTIWSGRVADPNESDVDTVAIRQLNEKLYQDERVALSMLTVGDGLTLAMKR